MRVIAIDFIKNIGGNKKNTLEITYASCKAKHPKSPAFRQLLITYSVITGLQRALIIQFLFNDWLRVYPTVVSI